MIGKSEVPRFAVLLMGIILLAFTFLSAYLFLQEDLSIISTTGLEELFSEAFGPLIEACIRVMYLGIMGWIGSIITVRGVQLLTSPKSEIVPKVKEETVPPVKSPIKKTRRSTHSSTRMSGKKDR